MCAECLKKHTNIQICVYTFAHAYVFKPEARRVILRAVHSSPYIRGAAQSEQCVLSCIAGTEFSVCWEKWATCVSVWPLCSDENGVHRRTEWYVFCMLSFCVLGCFFSVFAYVWDVSMLDSQTSCSTCSKETMMKVTSHDMACFPTLAVGEVKPLPYYSRFVKFCFIPWAITTWVAVVFFFFFLAHNVGGTVFSRMAGLPTVGADQYQLRK